MPDMLVKLYNLKEDVSLYETLEKKGIFIKRVMPSDKNLLLNFIKQNFNDGWAGECERALAALPSTCYVAVKDKKILGFACYDATAKDFFGPTGVLESERGQKIGEALLKKSLYSMKEAGYAYAIIGWVEDALGFYQKTVGAIPIEDSFPGVYDNMVSID